MTELKIKRLQPGSVSCIARPDGTTDAYAFAVEFTISASLETEHSRVAVSFPFAALIESDSPDIPHQEIEERGAQALPALLRDLADAVQQDLDQTARDRKTKSSAAG